MDIRINTNISQELGEEEFHITIDASKNSITLNKIVENIQAISDNINTIIGTQNNEIYIINIRNVIKFYSKTPYNYCVTSDGEFRIKKKLYELEEVLGKTNFIRISNSCIVNIKFVKKFDLSLIGNIIISLQDGTIENVSKRRITSVMKFLKGGN